jgi:phage anti-repressor protein
MNIFKIWIMFNNDKFIESLYFIKCRHINKLFLNYFNLIFNFFFEFMNLFIKFVYILYFS